MPSPRAQALASTDPPQRALPQAPFQGPGRLWHHPRRRRPYRPTPCWSAHRLLAADCADNNSRPEDFQLPARALGFQVLFSYRRDQFGTQTEHAGALQVEGIWHCPHMPQALVNASRDHTDKVIGADTYTQRIAARRAYELRPKTRPDAEGHLRSAPSRASPSRPPPVPSAPKPCPRARNGGRPTGACGQATKDPTATPGTPTTASTSKTPHSAGSGASPPKPSCSPSNSPPSTCTNGKGGAQHTTPNERSEPPTDAGPPRV